MPVYVTHFTPSLDAACLCVTLLLLLMMMVFFSIFHCTHYGICPHRVIVRIHYCLRIVHVDQVVHAGAFVQAPLSVFFLYQLNYFYQTPLN